MKDKLQLTLCSGLPYGLKFIDESERLRMIDLIEQSHFLGGGSPGFYHSEKATKTLSTVMGKKMVMDEDLKSYHVLDIKPILRSMDDLTKDHIKELYKTYPNCPNWQFIVKHDHVMRFNLNGLCDSNAEYCIVQQLIEWHFNVFNLDPDQYIDVKDLKDNCYE